MADHNRKGRSKNTRLPWESCHVELINGFRQEAAWRALKASTRVCYVELKSLFNGFNNGKIMASERHLAKLTGFSKNTVSGALDELVAAGFIVQMQRGVLGSDGKGTGSLWRLTELGCLGERPSRDYRKAIPKNRIPGQNLTQGGSKPDPQNEPGGSKADPGWVKNCPRKGPNSAGPWVKNCSNLVELPTGVGDPASSTRESGGEFVGAPRRFKAKAPGGGRGGAA